MQLKPTIASGIRNLIFDFGGVLLDIDIPLSVDAFRALGLSGLKPEEIHPHNAGVFLDLEFGKITTRQFVERLQSYVPAGQPVPSAQQILDAWNTLLLPYDWSRFELLERLRQSGYRIYLLSNTNLPHREYFVQRFDRENPLHRTFESYFDRCFYSDAMHLRKPDPAIYRTALEQAGIAADETLFIDDNRPNTDAAERVGIHAWHLAAPTTIHDLFE